MTSIFYNFLRTGRVRWLAAVALTGLVVYLGLHRGIMDSIEEGSATIAGLNDGLIGYWKFDGGSDHAVDSSGNNNYGVFINSALAPGRYGQALKLSGDNNSHVSIPASQSLDNFTDKITVTAWVFPERPLNDYKVIVSRQIGVLGHPDQFYLGFGPSEGITRYKWHLGTIENGTVIDRSLYKGSAASNRWIHMAGVYDGKMACLYIDGVKIGHHPHTGMIQVDDNPVTIGAEENGPEPLKVANNFEGKIDEVRIYNRALNSAEIKLIYQQAPPK